MREIKFKGWTGEQMLPAEDLTVAPEFRTWLGKVDCTLLQLTGLKDKNGNEVYEGDVLKGGDNVRIGQDKKCFFDFGNDGEEDFNIYGDVCGVYFTSGNSKSFYPSHGQNYDEMEVVGNIYENPELLK